MVPSLDLSQYLTVVRYAAPMSGVTLTDFDIVLAARSMIQHYGCDAAKEAARRANDALTKGFTVSCATWKRIMAAIEQLQAEKPEPGETVQ
jgi:hypothetical protein